MKDQGRTWLERLAREELPLAFSQAKQDKKAVAGYFGNGSVSIWTLVLTCLLWGLGNCGVLALEPIQRDYLLRVWDIEEGLPQISAVTIAQSADGYLWIGTFDGLARFDGVQFETLRPADTPGLPSAAVVKLLVDRSGRLWAGTDKGVAVREKGGWRSFGRKEGWPALLPKSLVQDGQGTVFATAGPQILRFDGHGFVRIPSPERAGDESTLSAAVDGGGVLWVLGDKYLGRLENGAWSEVLSPQDVGEGRLEGIGRGRTGGMWVADSTRVRKLENGRWTVTRERPPAFQRDTPASLLEDSEGNLWVGGFGRGLVVFGADGRVLKGTREDGLPGNGISAVTEDREGNIWVGTGTGGLARLKARTFTTYDDPAQLHSALLSSVTEEAPGRLVVGGSGLIPFAEGRFASPIQSQKPSFHSGFQVLTVLTDERGVLWAGTRGGGLFTVEGGRVEEIASPLVTQRSIFALYQDSQQTIWIGTDAGLVSAQAGEFTRHDRGAGLPETTFHAMTEDENGALWVGNEADGIFKREGSAFVPVLPRGEPIRGVLALARGIRHHLWLGTRTGRVLCFREGQWFELSRTPGHAPIEIRCLVEDGQENLWIGSAQGIARMTRRALDLNLSSGGATPPEIQVFGHSDGLAAGIDAEPGQPAVCRARDGRLWFATVKGLAVVDPRKVKPGAQPPSILIEGLAVDGARWPVSNALGRPTIIPAGARYLEVQYTTPSLTAPENVRFQYRIDELDREWRDVGAQREVSLRDLRPGDYQFRVRAADHTGLWSERDATLALTVQPFLWQRWWFRLTSMVTVAAYAAQRLWRIHQNRLRRRTDEMIREAYQFSQGTIDSLLVSLCVLDENGTITAVNKAWLEFAAANGAKQPDGWKGANYLQICDRVQGPDAVEAAAFATGIRQVLRGEREAFTMEYACHEPSQQRWCVGHVTRFAALHELRAVVAHQDITQRKRSELTLRSSHDLLESRVRERTAQLQNVNDQLEAGRQRLVTMSLRLLEIQEAERRSVARELHDEIGQILTSLRMMLDMPARRPAEAEAEMLAEARGLAGELMERVRQLSLNLRPPMLDDLGLGATLEWHFKRYTRLTGIEVQSRRSGLEERLSPAIETAAYRLIQEALTNVARYAQVKRVAVSLCRESANLYLTVEDHGVGFNADAVLRGNNSNGLSGMRERVDLLRGDFEITSTASVGTRISVRLPLAETREALELSCSRSSP